VDRIQHLKFKAKKKERGGGNKMTPVNKHNGPSPAARERIPKMKVARPTDIFNLLIMPEFVQCMTNATDHRATSGGNCSGEFKDWVPLDYAEIYRFIGVLFANVLMPKPRIDYWFEPAQMSPLFGNDIVSRAMAKDKVPLTGKRIQGIC